MIPSQPDPKRRLSPPDDQGRSPRIRRRLFFGRMSSPPPVDMNTEEDRTESIPDRAAPLTDVGGGLALLTDVGATPARPTAARATPARLTRLTRRRYDRNAPLYDMMERIAETGGVAQWRSRLWQLVAGEEILEVGVGTGRNLAYYPSSSRVTAIDLSPRMLERARRRADALGRPHVQLLEMDIEHTPFPDASFDAAVSTCVFCSVPDPVAGLGEIRRVLRPGGRLYTLEHVLSRKPMVRQLMQLANPLVVRIGGENINRDTRRNLEIAGFRVVTAEPLCWDIFWLFVAEK